MYKITYYVIYETGNEYEPTDYIKEVMYFDDYFTTSEIKEALWDEIKINFGDNAWLGDWEVDEL